VTIPYEKPYLPVPQQIDLLRSRGMAISDQEQAEAWLKRVGYYRLSGYWYPFRERQTTQAADGSEQVVVLDSFRPGTELSHAFALYVFDKRLRLLMLDAIERIEVGLRVDIALLMGKDDPWAHRNPNNFNRYFRNLDPDDLAVRHTKWLSYLDALGARSREEFAKHFYTKYKDPFPIWIAVELWDFGTLSTLVNGMKDKDLQHLADKYGVPRRTMLVSWMQSINFVRNVCAHHGRLWNRPLVIQPAPPRGNEIPLFQHWSKDTYAKTRMYAAASILQLLLRTISPGSSWGERLKELMSTFPGGPGLLQAPGGFPKGWEEMPLWNEANPRQLTLPTS
jgi:abortive infection bacteriophage resistance protein